MMKSLRALSLASLLVAASAQAAVVWQFNPSNTNAPAGTSSLELTSGGSQLRITGYDNNGSTPSAQHELYFKSEPQFNGAVERGIGLVNTPSNEFNAGNTPGTPVNYLQLDLRAILAEGYTNGQIQVASLQNGEGFQLFGSNVAGTLGTAIGSAFTGLAFDDKFVAIPSFGAFQFISIGAATGNVLPVAFMADMTVVPEVGALLPIVALLAVVGTTTYFRRRRVAAAV